MAKRFQQHPVGSLQPLSKGEGIKVKSISWKCKNFPLLTHEWTNNYIYDDDDDDIYDDDDG